MKSIELDRLDFEIVRVLSEEPDLTNKAVAAAVGAALLVGCDALAQTLTMLLAGAHLSQRAGIPAGAVAAVAGPVCLLVPVLFLARRANVTTLVIGTSLTVAGAMALRNPLGSTIAATGTFSPLAQTAAALAIGAVAVSLLRPSPDLAVEGSAPSTTTSTTTSTDAADSSDEEGISEPPGT